MLLTAAKDFSQLTKRRRGDMYSNLGRMIERTRIMREHVSILRETFDAWAYDEVIVPVLTDHELFRRQNPLPSSALYKMIDGEGEVLVLRPDMTAPLAHMAAGQWRDVPRPIRLCYFGEVYRRRLNGRGTHTLTQAGVELLGAEEPEADAELIALAAEALCALGVRQFQINLGHNGLLAELSDVLDLSPGEDDELRSALADRDLVGARDVLERRRHCGLVEPLLRIFAPGATADHLALLAELGESLRGLHRLRHIFEAAMDLGVHERVQIDVSLAGDFSYYTGAIFEMYCPQSGARLGVGGRYDGLLGSFGSPGAATGFALDLDMIQEAAACHEKAGRQKTCLVVADGHRRRTAYQRAAQLRDEGHRVAVKMIGDGPVGREIESWARARDYDSVIVIDACGCEHTRSASTRTGGGYDE